MAKVFPIVWDRFTELDGDYNIYGWIKRKDGQRDFVLLQLYIEGEDIKGGFVTSSAKYSAPICNYMYGESKDHNNCLKIESLKQ